MEAKELKSIIIIKPAATFTLTYQGGHSFLITSENAELWANGDSEFNEKDYKVPNFTGGYDTEKKHIKFGLYRYAKTKSGAKGTGLNLDEEQIAWFESVINEDKLKWDQVRADRANDRPSPSLDLSNIIIYNIGCDTGLIHTNANKAALQLAINNGAEISPILRGERDGTNKFPGHMDDHIPSSYATKVDGKWSAVGYEYVYEDLYSISKVDYETALAVINGKLEEDQYQVQAKFNLAKSTGEKVLLYKTTAHESDTPLAGDGEDDIVDVITYAMPDGTTKVEYYHNY